MYQTSDPEFADRGVAALEKAGIACYRLGEGARKLDPTFGRWTDKQIGLYIKEPSEVPRANEILVSLGAVVDTPIRIPRAWIIVLALAALVVLGVLAAGR